MTKDQKKQIIITHYDIYEVADILGYNDNSNPDLPMDDLEFYEQIDFVVFTGLLLDCAVENGNFEEVIKTNSRFAL